jgi:hypothetical protein
MIAVQLMNRDHLRRAPNRPARAIKPEGEHAGTLLTEESTRFTTPFQPLDPSIVSEAIPVFFIGRNKEGIWVARDVKGKIGGLFLFESSALSFARRKCRRVQQYTNPRRLNSTSRTGAIHSLRTSHR